MQILKTLSISLLLSTLVVSTPLKSHVNVVKVNYSETPGKTICLKNPAALNTTEFFASTTTLMFEVYKPGSKEEMSKIVAALKKDANVQECVEGNVTGDYYAVTLILKAKKDKSWFVGLFKKAGLATIKINNAPVTEVGNM